MRDAHALAAAARHGLEHDRVAELAGNLRRLAAVARQGVVAGYDREPRLPRQSLRLELVAHRLDGRSTGADEGDARAFQRLGERRVLGQEAVTRVHRLGAGVVNGLENVLDRQVALGRRRRTDGDRLVGPAHVQRVLVGLRVDRDALDPHAPGRAHDAAGDLTPVGDQDLGEHRARPFL